MKKKKKETYGRPTLAEFRQWRDEYAEVIEFIYDYFKEKKGIEPLGKTEQFTFPSKSEFEDEFLGSSMMIDDVYEWFRNRVQQVEIGREYEFSDNRRKWIRAVLNEYVTNIGHFEHIRPIQPKTKPKPNPNREQVLEAVINARNVQDGDMVMIHDIIVDAVIKLLEATHE
jgi:hypothetical protein